MIKKIALTTALLVFVYNLLLSFNPRVETSQYHWQENEIRPQKYIYRDSSFANVIVGTSLSFGFPMDSLPGFYNLSLIGRSPFDGLSILCHSPVKMPKKIFIETNFYMKPGDSSFVQSFFSPLSFYYRALFLAARAGKQPIPLAISTVANLLKRNLPPAKQQSDNIDKKLFVNLSEANAGIYTSSPDSLKLFQQLRELSTYVQMLEKNNVEIVFFEMPVDESFNNSALATTARDLLVKTFPKDRYHYIKQPDCHDYSTTDGIHLNHASSLRYIAYLKKSIVENNY